MSADTRKWFNAWQLWQIFPEAEKFLGAWCYLHLEKDCLFWAASSLFLMLWILILVLKWVYLNPAIFGFLENDCINMCRWCRGRLQNDKKKLYFDISVKLKFSKILFKDNPASLKWHLCMILFCRTCIIQLLILCSKAAPNLNWSLRI